LLGLRQLGCRIADGRSRYHALARPWGHFDGDHDTEPDLVPRGVAKACLPVHVERLDGNGTLWSLGGVAP
jgi:hypothetical protein